MKFNQRTFPGQTTPIKIQCLTSIRHRISISGQDQSVHPVAMIIRIPRTYFGTGENTQLIRNVYDSFFFWKQNSIPDILQNLTSKTAVLGTTLVFEETKYPTSNSVID